MIGPCSATSRAGASCRMPALKDRDTCRAHTPELAEARLAASRRGGVNRHRPPEPEPRRRGLDRSSAGRKGWRTRHRSRDQVAEAAAVNRPPLSAPWLIAPRYRDRAELDAALAEIERQWSAEELGGYVNAVRAEHARLVAEDWWTKAEASLQVFEDAKAVLRNGAVSKRRRSRLLGEELDDEEDES